MSKPVTILLFKYQQSFIERGNEFTYLGIIITYGVQPEYSNPSLWMWNMVDDPGYYQ